MLGLRALWRERRLNILIGTVMVTVPLSAGMLRATGINHTATPAQLFLLALITCGVVISIPISMFIFKGRAGGSPIDGDDARAIRQASER